MLDTCVIPSDARDLFFDSRGDITESARVIPESMVVMPSEVRDLLLPPRRVPTRWTADWIGLMVADKDANPRSSMIRGIGSIRSLTVARRFLSENVF